MGLFLGVSAAVNVSADRLVDAVRSYLASVGYELRSSEQSSDEALLMIEQDSNTSALWPPSISDVGTASRHLSHYLSAPVFSFHIHDGDLWMFELFDDGQRITGFNPIPDYWGEVDDDERSQWTADIEAICGKVPQVSAPEIRRYLVPWSLEILSGTAEISRAYPDDEFTTGQDWQMIDFMKRMRLPYPAPEDPESLAFETVRCVSASSTRPSAPRRPWWRFW